MSVLLNTFKSVVLKPMGHNTVSHSVTHKYKSCMGYWVQYQKIAEKSKGLNGCSSAHLLSHPCIQGRLFIQSACIHMRAHRFVALCWTLRFYCIPLLGPVHVRVFPDSGLDFVNDNTSCQGLVINCYLRNYERILMAVLSFTYSKCTHLKILGEVQHKAYNFTCFSSN